MHIRFFLFLKDMFETKCLSSTVALVSSLHACFGNESALVRPESSSSSCSSSTRRRAEKKRRPRGRAQRVLGEVHPPLQRALPPGADLPDRPSNHRGIFRKCIFRKCIFRKFCKFLAGSFSAVSKRNFARKYAFDSIFQALQDLHPFAPLQSQKFSKKSVW